MVKLILDEKSLIPKLRFKEESDQTKREKRKETDKDKIKINISSEDDENTVAYEREKNDKKEQKNSERSTDS